MIQWELPRALDTLPKDRAVPVNAIMVNKGWRPLSWSLALKGPVLQQNHEGAMKSALCVPILGDHTFLAQLLRLKHPDAASHRQG